MSFTTCLAGPSRRPLLSAPRCSQLLASNNYATTPSSPDDMSDEPPLPFPLDTDSPPTQREDELDRDARAAALQEKKLWASSKGFDQWKRSFGAEYSRHNKGDRAKWLGGPVVSLSEVPQSFHLTKS